MRKLCTQLLCLSPFVKRVSGTRPRQHTPKAVPDKPDRRFSNDKVPSNFFVTKLQTVYNKCAEWLNRWPLKKRDMGSRKWLATRVIQLWFRGSDINQEIKESEITEELTDNKKLKQHASLRDQMAAEDGVDIGILLNSPTINEIINTEEIKEPSRSCYNTCNTSYRVKGVLHRSLSIVVLYDKGTGLLMKLLFRRRKNMNRKKLLKFVSSLEVTVNMHFKKVDANLVYGRQILGAKEIGMIYLPPNEEKSNVNVVLRGERVLQLINGDEKLVYESENKSGVYKIGLKVRFHLRQQPTVEGRDNIRNH
ncbi:uncharacterized protein [Rutidosis leptorrhynchoides]|uniref:uncharacterized protein n=1 Tax=Rutidosis leptorrhynchoides TaxID=125765 RepID=UPI003A994621